MRTNLKLDIKDKKILKELFRDGRIPFSLVAKKVGMSKEVVNYRVNKMLERGLLLGFNSVYDVKRIGWKIYMVYLKLKSIDNKREQEIINTLKSHKNVAWVIKCIGYYDIIIKIFARESHEYNHTIKEIESLIGLSLSDYDSDAAEREHPVQIPFLYAPVNPDRHEDIRKEGDFKISNIDISILEELAHDARMPLSDMASKLSVSRDLLKYHLKKLEEELIILKYRPSAWSGSKSLGFSWYLISLKLRQLETEKQMTLFSYIANHPNVTYFYELTGEHDFGFEIRIKTGDELNDVMMQIRSILGEDLKSHILNLILKEYKYTYFPDCLKETIKTTQH
ncbi:MAG: Lrp/AsnC family transcriptional regulator [archaeon]